MAGQRSKPADHVVSRLQQDQEFSIPGFCEILGSRDFSGWDYPKIFIPIFYQRSIGSLGIFYSSHTSGHLHTFWRNYLFVKYIIQTKVSSIPSCGKQQERAGVRCCWQRGDPKKSLPHTRESRSLSYCQIQPWLRDMGFQNKK